jgi:hypothetical protein
MSDEFPKTWLDDEILCVDYGPHARHTRENQDKIYKRHMELAPGRKSPVLVFLHSVLASDRDAEKHTSSEELVSVISAMALVTRTPLSNHLAQMFMWFSRPPYPTKLFSDERKAREWLLQFINKQ